MLTVWFEMTDGTVDGINFNQESEISMDTRRAERSRKKKQSRHPLNFTFLFFVHSALTGKKKQEKKQN